MSAPSRPEVWLRGPLPGIDPVLMPAVHTLLQARARARARRPPGAQISEALMPTDARVAFGGEGGSGDWGDSDA